MLAGKISHYEVVEVTNDQQIGVVGWSTGLQGETYLEANQKATSLRRKGKNVFISYVATA